jgi:hypothetical protein
MAYGLVIKKEYFNRFQNLLNSEGIYDWDIWNINDYLTHNDDVVKIEFNNDQEFYKAFDVWKKVTLN